MLTDEQIERIAKDAARVASELLSLEKEYTISVIDDPNYIQDGLLDTQESSIIINRATLEPYPVESYPPKPDATEDDLEFNENVRTALKICFITYHEVRHLYQVWAVNNYTINKMLGGRMAKQPESDKKCALWAEELKSYRLDDGRSWDVEEDADAFAYYLLHRYPVPSEMTITDRRLGVFKRKYNKIEVHYPPGITSGE